MLSHVTSRPRITGVKVSANISSIPPFASTSCALKDMDSTVIFVFNPRRRSEEDIDWRNENLDKLSSASSLSASTSSSSSSWSSSSSSSSSPTTKGKSSSLPSAASRMCPGLRGGFEWRWSRSSSTSSIVGDGECKRIDLTFFPWDPVETTGSPLSSSGALRFRGPSGAEMVDIV
ncbi:hypothetical protein BDN72DRAFT_419292 [Pluteus cervinus]|uniref:Uncharacterized protein n=1 Tax=Pluteus cervinus TaxID=181527 RepID=A0ACD3A7R6_9AGAR|nr:hypothetical protein BDN72DRAFT_419292 [Pluteus cervinus]